MTTGRALPLLLLALAGCGSTAESRDAQDARGAWVPDGPRWSWTFDDVAPGALPPGWEVAGTNQHGPLAAWSVEGAEDAASGPSALVLTDAREGASGTFNLCWTDEVLFGDGVVEVSVRARTGREDQGGGPVWRVRDAANYYVARWNPLEDNFRLYFVRDGRRVQIASARVRADPSAWHTIRIEHRGDRIVGSLDGEALLEARDDTHPEAGGVGVWTKADAATAFDDFTVTAAAR